MKHFLTSLINSGLVTIITSFVMTQINSSDPSFELWTRNWIVSWSIVFYYVFTMAPTVHRVIHRGDRQ